MGREKIFCPEKKFYVGRNNFKTPGENLLKRNLISKFREEISRSKNLISKLREEISWNGNSILNPDRKSPETKIRFQIRGENLLEQKFDFKTRRENLREQKFNFKTPKRNLWAGESIFYFRFRNAD
jgi:hypothetical protein